MVRSRLYEGEDNVSCATRLNYVDSLMNSISQPATFQYPLEVFAKELVAAVEVIGLPRSAKEDIMRAAMHARQEILEANAAHAEVEAARHAGVTPDLSKKALHDLMAEHHMKVAMQILSREALNVLVDKCYPENE